MYFGLLLAPLQIVALSVTAELLERPYFTVIWILRLATSNLKRKKHSVYST